MVSDGAVRDLDGTLEQIRDNLLVLVAEAAPQPPPDWWLRHNRIPPGKVDFPEVPEELQKLWSIYDAERHGYPRGGFPPRDFAGSVIDIERVREIGRVRDRIIVQNGETAAMAELETNLQWKAYYVRRVRHAVLLELRG
jgi:hypothetical protein